MTPWLSVVGIGEDGTDGLAPAARTLVETAEILVGGARHLALVDGCAMGAERLPWRQPLTDTIADIAARRGRRVVVLASGDPMWFGVGATLAQHFSRDEMHIVPVPGAFSLAAARMGWALQDVDCLSLHGRPLDLLRAVVTPGARLLALSEDGSTPRRVAGLLRGLGFGPSAMTVLEHLGGAGEKLVTRTAEDWDEREVADLNTIAIDCRAGPGARVLSRSPGLPDEAFGHDGQITKRAVRAATLAALAPLPGQTLWDLGAGSGSIAIEWLRAVRGARAHAVERDPARATLMAQNAQALGVPHLDIVVDTADDAVARLPPPDAVFVGGGITTSLVDASWQALRPGGRLVANVVTLDGEAAILVCQARFGGTLTRLAVSVAEPLGGHLAWRALRPVMQWAALKP